MSKHTVRCVDWRPLVKNTLRGFATIKIAELKLVIHDVAVHQKNTARWAQLPAKPQVRDGELVKEAGTGKLAYTTILEFERPEVRSAFSDAVITALLEFAPDAFGEGAS